jgi:hypothetical protein
MRITIFIILLFIFKNNLVKADEIDFIKFDNGNTWPIFKHPKFFQITDDSYKGEKNKWIAILKSDKENLILEVSPFGFVHQMYKDKGFDSPRDVILIEEINVPTRRITKKDFEIIIEEREDKWCVFFIQNNPDWGRCYNTMIIKFKNGDGPKHSKVFDQIIHSFEPSFILRPE